MLPEQFRRFIASTVIWGVFFTMYLLVVGALALGVYFTSETWWSRFQHRASTWVMAYQSGRVILLIVALLFVLAQPVIQLTAGRRRAHYWRTERRSGFKD